jgi:hypothetical protein
MITKNNRWAVRSSTGRKTEKSVRKFRTKTNRSFAFLQPRRRERLPLELVELLQTLTGDESGLIVFTAKEDSDGDL